MIKYMTEHEFYDCQNQVLQFKKEFQNDKKIIIPLLPYYYDELNSNFIGNLVFKFDEFFINRFYLKHFVSFLNSHSDRYEYKGYIKIIKQVWYVDFRLFGYKKF